MISKTRYDFIKEQLDLFYKNWALYKDSYPSHTHYSMDNIIRIMGVRQSGNTSALQFLYGNLTNAYVMTNNNQTFPVSYMRNKNRRVIDLRDVKRNLMGIRNDFVGALLVDYSCPKGYDNLEESLVEALQMLSLTKRSALIDFPIPVIVG